ncbi:hypothetical protein L596_014462 [Steinernema carpocapsae]|uniref:Transcription factor TFIIE alpha subunit C-terminal domain-containing protein n=1 Tax=Steinernema carpocapsae TaxID=34508 RepID=A0A4U5NCU0_STECR|nr:hypothetical protein L596_014462 [Steinernema carpocapsae]
MDLTTGEMRCWRCQSIVEPDRAAGPTDLTRTSLAKFNEQMAVLFSIMQSLDGIRLAQHLLEPPVQNITTESQEDDKNEKKFLQVGAKAFGGHHSSRKDMYNQEVTVNIIDGNAPVPVVQEKESVPWLSTDSNFDVNADLNPKPALGFASSSAPVLSYVAEEQQRMKARIHTAESFSRLPEVQALLKFEKDLLKEHEQKEEAVAAERPRGRVLFTLEEENYEPMDVDEQMDDEEYIQLTIQGHPVDFEEIAADPDLIKKMAQDELQLYIEVWREHMEY